MLTAEDLDRMSKMGIKDIDRTNLVDIKSISVGPALPAQEKMMSYLSKIKNPYCFLCGSTPVGMRFVSEKRTLTEAFISYCKSLK